MTGSTLISGPAAGCRTQRVAIPDGERTWTVLDGEHRVVVPVEQFLEYLRILRRSPNTVKSYARALALWWQFLTVYELAWDAVTVEDLGRFLGWLRTGDSPALVSIERRSARFSEGTIALRLQRDPAASAPRYLFLAVSRNHHGRHSYPKTTVTLRLKQLGELADIRDSQGRRRLPMTSAPPTSRAACSSTRIPLEPVRNRTPSCAFSLGPM